MNQFLRHLIILLFISLTSVAQSKYFINGVIGIQGGELYSYDMTLYSTSNPHEFKGTVKTYALINKEVTAEVMMTIDPKNRTARLVETRIIENKGFQSNTTICLVDAALTYDEKNGVLKGPIITQTSGGAAYCAIGNVTFTSTNDLQKIFNISPQSSLDASTASVPSQPQPSPQRLNNPKPQPTVTPKSNTPTTTSTNPQQTPTSSAPIEPPKIKEVTAGKDAEIEWTSDVIILEVWDDNKIDGDRISIFINNKEILYNYQLTSQIKKLEIPINGQELNIITIVAMNEGTEPPNTAMIHLIDGNKEPLKIVSHNVAGKSSNIRIRKRL